MSTPYARRAPSVIKLGSVGQSQSIRVTGAIDAANGGIAWFKGLTWWAKRYYNITMDVPGILTRNWGQNGSGVSSVVPGATSWAEGAASGYRAAALAGLAANGVTHCEVTFGTRDGDLGATAQQYHDGLKSLVDAIVGIGIKCMVNHCPNTQSAARDTVSAGWDSYIAAEVDNEWIFEGANFYSAMRYKGTGAQSAFWNNGADEDHQQLAGNEFFARRLISRYALTGWLLK
jgi:hypothetical protein